MSSTEVVMRMVAFRKAKKWTQQDLADKSGVNIATIRSIEQGGGWTNTTMDKINDALGGAVY